jgi:hypothetical protein
VKVGLDENLREIGIAGQELANFRGDRYQQILAGRTYRI